MDQIVAIDKKRTIGNKGELLFSIPDDLAHFKDLTLGYAIVYGRSTLATFPDAQPLPGRRNYVLTSDIESLPLGAIGVSSVPSLFESIRNEEKVFVVGGQSVYEELLPYCKHAYVTKVDLECSGDRWYPNLDENEDWELIEISDTKTYNNYEYCFCTYVNHDVMDYAVEQKAKQWRLYLAICTLLAFILMAVISVVVPRGHMVLYTFMLIFIVVCWIAINSYSLWDYIQFKHKREAVL